MFYMIIVFIVVGFLLWAVNTYLPMDPNVKKLMNIAVILLLIIWVAYTLLGGVASTSPPILR